MLSLFKRNLTETESVKPVVLLILDGWGIAPPSGGNAIALAKKPNMDQLMAEYPNTQLLASGESVGLPANEVGNTEVGHLTMGAGRVIPQSLKRISLSIEDGSFFENKAFLDAYNHSQKNNSAIHLMGLVGSGNVHSSLGHLFKLLDMYSKYKPAKLYLHLFTDGRDSPPKESAEIMQKIESYLKSIKIGQIASVAGRYYAMDRDKRWERTQKAYEALTEGKGVLVNSATEAIQSAYTKGLTDEFIEPSLVCVNGAPIGVIKDNDAVVFFNFRIDRPRQLTMAFTLPDFEDPKDFKFGYVPDQGTKSKEELKGKTFTRGKKLTNLFFATMTEYQEGLPVSAVAFPPHQVVASLPEVLSKAGVSQMHMAESEKERMVTFYFDGLREGKFTGEEHAIVPSPRVATYDLKPEMSVLKVASEFKKQIDKNIYKFFVINFANPDMVAHTGNLKASIKAIEVADKAIGEMAKKTLECFGTLLITADHGNAEDLLTYPTGSFFYTTNTGVKNTDHSNNPVPLLLIGKQFKGRGEILLKGSLADIAPTALTLLGLQKPAEMTGNSLIRVDQ